MGRVLVQQPGTTTAKALKETLPKNIIIVDEDLKELRLHDGVTPGGKIIGQSAGAGVPVGTIIPFAGNAIPQGYLLCDGSAISRTDYKSLFGVIGTAYGAGNGNSTFNIPKYIAGETLVRGQPGWHTNGMAPNIKGGLFVSDGSGSFDNIGLPPYVTDGCANGAFFTENNSGTTQGWSAVANNSTTTRGYKFDASLYHDCYNNQTNQIRAAGVGTNFCIKYI